MNQASLERFYTTVLRIYPGWYRETRGEEILGVLMEGDAGPSVGETASLVRHGLALRLFGPNQRGVWRQPLAAAAVLVAAVVGALGLVTALDSALSAYLLTFRPNPSSVPYVDPLWGAATCSVVALGLVLLRQGWAAMVAAWAAVVLQIMVLAGVFGLDGSAGWPYLEFAGQFELAVHVVPTLAAALLLSRPGRVREGLAVVGRRPLLLIVLLVFLPPFVGMGSELWPYAVGLAVSLVVLFRRGLALRGGLAVLLGFAWLATVPLADGSGSRLPVGPVGLSISLGMLPLLAVPVLVMLTRNFEVGGFLRRRLVALTESLARAARGDDQDVAGSQ
jgi:hypothetical protein